MANDWKFKPFPLMILSSLDSKDIAYGSKNISLSVCIAFTRHISRNLHIKFYNSNEQIHVVHYYFNYNRNFVNEKGDYILREGD